MKCRSGGIGRRTGLKILRTTNSYRFESGLRHHYFIKNGGVAQVARACGSYPQCQRFKSVRRYTRPYSQAVKTSPFHGDDPGSSPGRVIWKLSSVGRASALQAEGHRFEPYSFHLCPNPIFQNLFSEKWLVGQTQRVPNLCDERSR